MIRAARCLSVAALCAAAWAANDPPAAPPTKGADLALLADVRRVAARVEQLRGERFARPPVAVRAPADVLAAAAEIRAFAAVDRLRLEARGRAWSDLGLGGVASPGRLLRMLAADLDGIAFDPTQGRLLVVPDRLRDEPLSQDGPEAGSAALLMLAGVQVDEAPAGHMLIHLRQRERRPTDFLAPTTDGLLTRAAWFEGEANLVALRYLFGAMGLADQVTASSVDPSQFLEGRLVPSGFDEWTGVEADFLRFIYVEGYAQAAARHRQGGFAALDQAMESVRTTRELLHPELPPVPAFEFPPPAAPVEGWSLADADALGEQGVIVLVSRVAGKDDLALQAGDGWAGDVLRRWEPAAGQAGGATEWWTRWRAAADVGDFEYALGRTLAVRFPGASIETPEPGVRLLATAERSFRIERRGDIVRLLVLDPGRLQGR